MKIIHLLSSMLLAITALSACTAPPMNNAKLEAIDNDYALAQSNPDVTRYAAIELQQAGIAVENANSAQRLQQDPVVVEHLMYVARQRIAIAQETAKLKVAEASIADISAKRAQIRLDMRTEEADIAQHNIDSAQKYSDQQDVKLNESRSELKHERSRFAEQAKKSDAADARIIAMEAELKELNAKQTTRGTVITLGDVLFDTSKADLKDNSIASVQKLAGFFKEYRGRTAVIEGYTDNTGDKSFNQALSEERARAVRNALISMGIEADRVSTRGYGEANPVADNSTAVGRQLNRRVEIVLSGDNEDNSAP